MKITVTLTQEFGNDSADLFELRTSIPNAAPLFLIHIAHAAVSFDDGHRLFHQPLAGPRIARPDAYETQYCSACFENPGLAYFSRYPFEFRGVTIRPSFWLCEACAENLTPEGGQRKDKAA